MLRILFYLALYLFSQTAVAISSPEGEWVVTNKTCDEKSETLKGNETIFLVNNFYVQSYRSFEDNERICNQTEKFTRIIQTVSSAANVYEEISILTPKTLRTVCKWKKSGEVISDTTIPIYGSEQQLHLVLQISQGVAELKNTSFCEQGILHLDIQKN